MSSKPRLPEGQAVDKQIKALGFKTSDISYVILSHLDVDHVSGVKLVSDAKHILVSKDEYKAGCSGQIRYYKALWQGVKLEKFSYMESDIGPYKKVKDIFGDGKIIIVETPGHSKGSCSLLVQNHDRQVLMVGDTGYATDSWKKMRMPGPIYNKAEMKKSLEWVSMMSAQKNCLSVLANHDPEITPHIIEL